MKASIMSETGVAETLPASGLGLYGGDLRYSAVARQRLEYGDVDLAAAEPRVVVERFAAEAQVASGHRLDGDPDGAVSHARDGVGECVEQLLLLLCGLAEVAPAAACDRGFPLVGRAAAERQQYGEEYVQNGFPHMLQAH